MYADMLAIFTNIHTRMEHCWKALYAHVEKHRVKFPRFYFLSPTEVLRITCTGNCVLSYT
jgi:hypothetical protein